MKKIALFCLLASALPYAFAAKAPDWIENPQKSYPKEKYFVAVRDAKDKDEAELRAVESIAAVFGQDVSSETEAESRMREKSLSGLKSETETEKKLNSKILRTMEQDDLIGIELAESYFDKKGGRHYALAIMDKEKAFSVYEKMVKNNDSKAKSYIQSAKAELYSLYSYSCLLSAYNYARINEKYAARLQVISLEKGGRIEKSLVKTAEITPMLLEVANKTKIAVKIENDDDKEIFSAFSQVLSDFGFIVSTDTPRYILAGKVSFLERKIEGKGITNAEYSVQCKITDGKNGDELAPWSISGREGSKTTEYARQRAVSAIKKKISSDYANDLKNALGEKYE